MIAMRALGDPDAFPSSDMGVRKGAGLVGLPTSPAELAGHRSDGGHGAPTPCQYLWAATDHPIQQWPPKGTPCTA